MCVRVRETTTRIEIGGEDGARLGNFFACDNVFCSSNNNNLECKLLTTTNNYANQSVCVCVGH